MKALLVEDSPTLRYAMTGYIADAGHETVVAESGEEALQLLEHQSVDVIIMDVEMPGLNGFETTRLIRERLGDSWIPIIFVSGKTDDKSFEEGINAGGDDYLAKPISPVVLNAKIRAMERISEMRRELRQLNKELENLSQRDSLTQLYNRRTFEDLAQRQWQQANRTQKPISLLMLDIDHFKLYNDHYGHPAGDRCLVKAAQAIQSALKRPIDILARYGGEEFIVLLPETDLKGARNVGENIKQAILAANIHHEKSTTSNIVTVSIGACTAPHTTGRRLNDLIKQADDLLYESKKQGRNRVSASEASHLKTVLVADDDDDTLFTIKTMLDGHCNLITSSDGEECLELAREVSPDLILMDVHMPGTDGIEACQQLKQQSGTASIPIILMSSLPRSEQLRLGKEAGANDCLEKPFEGRKALAKINRFLM
jgi:diguanylate cyclase (GGDEF)-like protein